MNELMELKNDSFVKPHFIEELGDDGLTAEEVAVSLNTRVNEVRRKLRDDKNETLKSLKLVISTLKNINGVEYEEFFLSTAAAKFFVARYESDIGDGYLEYLIRLDMAVARHFKESQARLTEASTTILQLEGYKSKFLALEKKIEDEGNKEATAEEYSKVDRALKWVLKMNGRLRKSYQLGFVSEIMEKFYLKGEDEGSVTYLPKKNLEAALDYILTRKFNMMTYKEFESKKEKVEIKKKRRY